MRSQPDRPAPTGRELAPLGPMRVAEPPPAAPRRTGFRGGFLTMVAVVLVAIGIYVYAPALADAMPAAEPALHGYVTAANALRAEVLNALDAAEEAIRTAAARVPF